MESCILINQKGGISTLCPLSGLPLLVYHLHAKQDIQEKFHEKNKYNMANRNLKQASYVDLSTVESLQFAPK